MRSNERRPRCEGGRSLCAFERRRNSRRGAIGKSARPERPRRDREIVNASILAGGPRGQALRFVTRTKGLSRLLAAFERFVEASHQHQY